MFGWKSKPKDFGPPPGVYSMSCAYPGCYSFSWARDLEEFEKKVSPQGYSFVKPTRTGEPACKEHALRVGGGWLT